MSHSLSHDGRSTNRSTQSRPGRTDAANSTAEFSVRRTDRAPTAADGSATTSGPSAAAHANWALLHDDRELATAIPSAEREHAARALRVDIHHLAPGPVDLGWLDLPQSTFAVLITCGAIRHDVLLENRVMTELLMEGDVLLADSPSPSTPESSRRLVVIHDTRLAVLDRRFMLAAAHWPGLMRAVTSRLADQQHRLAVHGAICQLPRVEQRIIAILCHLANRTGIITPQGMLLRHPFSHREIADLIGAQRSTVSLALASLRDQDLVRRGDDGSWLLPHYTGQPINFEDLIPPARQLKRGNRDFAMRG